MHPLNLSGVKRFSEKGTEKENPKSTRWYPMLELKRVYRLSTNKYNITKTRYG